VHLFLGAQHGLLNGISVPNRVSYNFPNELGHLRYNICVILLDFFN